MPTVGPALLPAAGTFDPDETGGDAELGAALAAGALGLLPDGVAEGVDGFPGVGPTDTAGGEEGGPTGLLGGAGGVVGLPGGLPRP